MASVTASGPARKIDIDKALPPVELPFVQPGWYYPPQPHSGSIDDTMQEPNVLLVTAKGKYLKCDMRFDPNDVEMFDVDGLDFTPALQKAADTYGVKRAQGINLMGCPTSHPYQRAWKLWLE